MYDLPCPFIDRLHHSVAGGYPVDLEWREEDGEIRTYLGEPLASQWRKFYPEMKKDKRIELFIGFDAKLAPIRLRALSCRSQVRELVKRIGERGYMCSTSL
jgi:hypothetical protein